MKILLFTGLIISGILRSVSADSVQPLFEGKWINTEYQQAILAKKDFSERSKLSFNFLRFAEDKVILEYRFEQSSEPNEIHFLNKEKTQFEALGFQFYYKADTIFMKSKEKVVARFVRYVVTNVTNHAPFSGKEEKEQPKLRYLIHAPVTSGVKSDENCKIVFSVVVDSGGNVTEKPLLVKQSTTTNDSLLIEKLSGIIWKEAKFNPSEKEKEKTMIVIRISPN